MPKPDQLRINPWEIFTPPASEKHPDAQHILDHINQRLAERGFNLHPMTREIFETKLFIEHLPSQLRENIDELASFAEHSSRLQELLYDQRIYGETLTLSRHGSHDRIHPDDEGQRVLLDELRKLGCDPKHVLIFRVTQPSDAPKPEGFWTTDFFETQRGLTREISPEDRMRSVTLVSTLATVSGDTGVIRDINDDGGLAVRQIEMKPFDQKQALAVIPSQE